MKKKLVALALVLALAVSALSLAACGTDFSKTYKNIYSNKDLEQFFVDQKVLNSQKDLNLDFEGVIDEDEGFNLGVFVKEGDNEKMTYKVYNFENDSVVATFTDTDTVRYYMDEDFINSLIIDMKFYDYFYVEKSTTDATTQTVKTEYFVYDANGNAIGSADEMPTTVFDTLFIGNDYYRIKKDKFEKAGSRAKNAMQLPEFDNLIDGKYYELNEEGDEYIAIYDNEFNMINYYKLPSYADLIEWGVLNDGNVIVQLACDVPETDSDYNVLFGNGQQLTKYKVVTEIYNVKKSEMKEIETTFLFNGNITAVNSFEGLNAKFSYGSSVENLARVAIITDKRVDQNSKYVSIKNNGEIDQILFEDFVGQNGNGVRPLFSGNFVVYTEDGSKLLNEKGKVIADVTDARFNNKYIVLDGKIYDHDFKELATFDEEKFNVQLMNNTVVLNSVENNKQYKLFVNGAFKEITLAEDETIVGGAERYYVIRKVTADATTYTYYNENGEALLTTALVLEKIGTTRNGKILFEGFDAANDKIVNIVLYTA